MPREILEGFQKLIDLDTLFPLYSNELPAIVDPRCFSSNQGKGHGQVEQLTSTESCRVGVSLFGSVSAFGFVGRVGCQSRKKKLFQTRNNPQNFTLLSSSPSLCKGACVGVKLSTVQTHVNGFEDLDVWRNETFQGIQVPVEGKIQLT